MFLQQKLTRCLRRREGRPESVQKARPFVRTGSLASTYSVYQWQFLPQALQPAQKFR